MSDLDWQRRGLWDDEGSNGFVERAGKGQKQVDEFQNGARHKAHDFLNTLSDFEKDNLMENLILICGEARFKQACNAVTGEQTLLILSGKEME
jgi:hypothetical protein